MTERDIIIAALLRSDERYRNFSVTDNGTVICVATKSEYIVELRFTPDGLLTEVEVPV